jgi:hypothetical protein
MIELSHYDCPACGEEIPVPLELDGSAHQEYVEDCPVCCRPIVLRVDVDRDGRASLRARAE